MINIDELKNILLKYLDSNLVNNVISSLDNMKTHSFILNKKICKNINDLKEIKNLRRSQIDDLIYFHDEIGLGNNIYNQLGLIYLMDSSSSLISYYLKDLVKKDGIVFDMCSAPGGKSISLSFRRNDLLFLANDQNYDRSKEIIKNINRLQLDNILVTSNKIDYYNFNNYFDLVILDAPCSGLGMIRKNNKILSDFDFSKVERLSNIQKSLLEKAYDLLKPGGILSYSTCTYTLEENENQIEYILKKHPDLKEIKIEVNDKIIKTKYGYHLFPGLFEGEGLYFNFLIKDGNNITCDELLKMNIIENRKVFKYKDNFYQTNKMYNKLSKINYLSPGIKVYDLDKYAKNKYTNEFIIMNDLYPHIEIDYDKAINYLKGNELILDLYNINDGLYILTYKGYKIGVANKKGNKIKNFLPKRNRIK